MNSVRAGKRNGNKAMEIIRRIAMGQTTGEIGSEMNFETKARRYTDRKRQRERKEKKQECNRVRSGRKKEKTQMSQIKQGREKQAREKKKIYITWREEFR